ncbi:LytTR family DNA-binding domain-containing protein [Ruegeria halocynthiae]|uniref:LytTR family DNA-binding domain-containing protein n=1 Tax=Ruegeria halocynthiae TaxID=985054 RepID=UPI00056C3409|nr:LytTR family DNA-binding domain-containing protein [Ruegeria halocynthiae]
MTNNLRLLLAEFTPLRMFAGLVFLPLLAFVLQPFPHMHLPFSLRLVFWVGVTMLALCVTWVSGKLTQKYFADAHFSLRDATLILVVLALFVPALWMMSWLLFMAGGQQAPDVLSVASYGALFATGLVLVQGREPAKPPVAEAPQSPRLMKRLPETFNGQIYRLTVRDHSVDVVTSEGTFSIRSRFTDAITEMEPMKGHCTHRSHWVSDDAITGVEKKDGKTFVRLRNDELVPVSRKYKPMLEQDGVI